MADTPEKIINRLVRRLSAMLFPPSWVWSSKPKAELRDSLQIPGRNGSEKLGHMLDLLCEPVWCKNKTYKQETFHRIEQSARLCNDYFILLLQQCSTTHNSKSEKNAYTMF